jgi:hypothetical protein
MRAQSWPVRQKPGALGFPNTYLHQYPLLPSALPAALEVLLDRDRVWVGVLMMVLWTCLKGAEAGWRYLKQDPHLGGRMPGGGVGASEALAGVLHFA